MGRKKTRITRWQDGSHESASDNYKEIKSKVTYTDWLETQDGVVNSQGEGESHESPFANPDKLSDEHEMWPGGEAYPGPMLELMNEAITKLSERELAVWNMLFVSDLDQQEAALELGISQAAVSQIAKRALTKIRKYMGVTE